MVLGPIISGVGRPLIPLGLTVGRIAIGRLGRRAGGLLRSVPGGRLIGAGLAVGGIAELAQQAIGLFEGEAQAGFPMQQRAPAGAPAVRPADIVVGGQGPVSFVKMWRAGEAIFAIDSEGKRWAFRPKLGIWKRTRVFTNIVISRKDVFRARRLIRTSKRLNAIRKGLR